MPIKLYSRPKDRSLEAFKDWMQGITYGAGTNEDAPVGMKLWIDDRQWVENWKKFWEKVDGSSAARRPGPA